MARSSVVGVVAIKDFSASRLEVDSDSSEPDVRSQRPMRMTSR